MWVNVFVISRVVTVWVWKRNAGKKDACQIRLELQASWWGSLNIGAYPKGDKNRLRYIQSIWVAEFQ